MVPDEFYDDLALYYDQMTNFEKRLVAVTQLMQSWLSEFQWTSLLDAGCGSGLYAISAAKCGMQSVGTDLSAEMLVKAIHNAEIHGTQVKFVQTDFSRITKTLNQNFDGIVCLGNTIPHLLTQRDIHIAFRNFHQLLDSRGTLVIEILNYHKILAQKNRIVKIGYSGKTQFIRFYDFFEKTIHFNTLLIDWENDNPKYKLLTTTLKPYRADELMKSAETAGFGKVELFGNLKQEPWNPETSNNLVMFVGK